MSRSRSSRPRAPLVGRRGWRTGRWATPCATRDLRVLEVIAGVLVIAARGGAPAGAGAWPARLARPPRRHAPPPRARARYGLTGAPAPDHPAPSTMPASAEETAALLGPGAGLRGPRPTRICAGWRRSPSRGGSRRRGRLPRGRRLGHVLRRPGGPRRAIREHPDGRQITLATSGPGDIFGELAMFDDERRSATVEATDELEALGILGGDMRRLMRRHPDIVGQARPSRSAAGCGRPTSAWPASRSRPCRAASRPCSPSSSSRPSGGRGRARRRGRRHAGRPRQARRLLARVRQPLPRRARARGRDHAGPGRLTVHDPAALQRYVV